MCPPGSVCPCRSQRPTLTHPEKHKNMTVRLQRIVFVMEKKKLGFRLLFSHSIIAKLSISGDATVNELQVMLVWFDLVSQVGGFFGFGVLFWHFFFTVFEWQLFIGQFSFLVLGLELWKIHKNYEIMKIDSKYIFFKK